MAQLSTSIGDQSDFVVHYMWNLIILKLAIPWKIEVLCGELKECVPITARAKRFPLKKGKSTAVAERKQILLILGHGITVHKSEGSTLAYMQGDLNQSTGKKTATGKNYQ